MEPNVIMNAVQVINIHDWNTPMTMEVYKALQIVTRAATEYSQVYDRSQMSMIEYERIWNE